MVLILKCQRGVKARKKLKENRYVCERMRFIISKENEIHMKTDSIIFRNLSQINSLWQSKLLV